MKIILSIIFFILLVAWIIKAIQIALSQKGLTWKSALNIFASVCLIIGAVGVLGPAFYSVTGIGASRSFEWPIGKTHDALKFPNGYIVVPHEPTGRVQVYDQALQFIRGWSVNAYGGSFELFPYDDNTLFIFTARGNMMYRYDLTGKLLLSQEYDDAGPKYKPKLMSVSIPTPIYLRIFTHPIKAWLIAMIGFFLLFVTGEGRVKKSSKAI